MSYQTLKAEILSHAENITHNNLSTYSIKTQGYKIHFLKLWPRYYALKKNGFKDWDLRSNDREYSQLDIVVFLEWNFEKSKYTKQVMIRIITHIEDIADFLEHHVIFTDKPFNEMDTLTPNKKEKIPC